MSAIPFYVPTNTTYVKVGMICTAVALSSVRMGIYADSSGLPGALITDFGSVATTVSGLVTIAITQALTPGWYWLACAAQGANGNHQAFNAGQVGGFVGTTSPTAIPGPAGYLSATSVPAGLPNPFGTPSVLAPATVVWLVPQ